MQAGYILTGVLWFLAAGDAPKTPDKADKALEGKWDLSLALNSKQLLNLYNVPFTIADGKISWARLPFVNNAKGTGTLVVDSTMSPPTVDLKAGSKVYKGIYRFRTSKDGKTEYLDMLFAKPDGERPTVFADSELEVPKDFTGFLFTAGRPKPGDPDAAKKELAGLQGTWQCKAGESNGKDDGPDAPKLWVLVFDKDKIVYKENGKVVAEGDVQIDATPSPKQITAHFAAQKQTDVMIFFRVGDSLVLCGHRDGKTRPTRFATGMEGGGAFLTVWERVK